MEAKARRLVLEKVVEPSTGLLRAPERICFGKCDCRKKSFSCDMFFLVSLKPQAKAKNGSARGFHL